MRVSLNMIYGNYNGNLRRMESDLYDLNNQIATKRRINKPSDDPIGTALSMRYRTTLTKIEQYTSNSNDASSWLNFTDDALYDANQYLQAVREDLVDCDTTSLTPEASIALANKLEEYKDGLMEVANSSLNGRYVFSGDKVTVPPYVKRAVVSGDILSLNSTNTIDVTALSNQFTIGLDGNVPVTITLSNLKTYDGSTGNDLNTLAVDIQEQLDYAFEIGQFSTLVKVKVTPENKLTFYAGTNPSDGNHTIVLGDSGQALLGQLGFDDNANTKELVGTNQLSELIQVMGKPGLINGTAQAGGATTLQLAAADTQAADYYNGWTIKITDGTGAGQSRTVIDYDGTDVMIDPAEPWATAPDGTSSYALYPPTVGTVITASNTPTPTIQLADYDVPADYYVGMPITITNGAGLEQTRTIVSYDPATQTATVDEQWGTLPDATSRYAIDPNYYTEANSKFRIKVGNELTQEISLIADNYTPQEFAAEIEARIQERGGAYANIQVTVTNDNRLRIVDASGNPQDIKLESGSEADILFSMGLENGVYSERAVMNYEGNQGSTEYDVNAGVRVEINTIGDQIFDPIFQHIDEAIQCLRAAETNDNARSLDLLSDSLANIDKDLSRVLVTETKVGAKVNRVEYNLTRLSASKENVTTLLSDNEDLDFTQAATDLAAKKIAYEAAMKAGAKILQMTLMDYV